MAEGLSTVLPVLSAKEAKYYELKFDAAHGKPARSDKPLKLGCVLSGG